MTGLKEKNSGLPALLVCCGILKREIRHLVEKNQWPVQLKFLDSSLHVYLDKLSATLSASLDRYPDHEKLLVYGTCHPRMDEIVSTAGAVRTPGQNCVELLLGRERFSRELSQGAFFLFEDWARRWDKISYKYFGNREIMREVFQDAHTHILCIRTPYSERFDSHAANVSQRVGLPLTWEDVDLHHLEETLKKSIRRILPGETL